VPHDVIDLIHSPNVVHGVHVPIALFRINQYSSYASADTNQRIPSGIFANTIKGIHTSSTITPSDLTCEYDKNPRSIFTIVMKLLNFSLAVRAIDKMFKNDYTVNQTALYTLFQQHITKDQFQYKDYNQQVLRNGKKAGIKALLQGAPGTNFSGKNALPIEFPILCQVQIKAPQADPNPNTAQWMLFSPNINTVVICNRTNTHAWTIG
jgi:hypothetical protein